MRICPPAASGNLGTWKSGNLEIWGLGNLGIWRSGDLEIHKFADLGAWKSRNLGSNNISKMKVLKSNIRVAQNIDKVWISRKNQLPTPFGAIPGKFFLNILLVAMWGKGGTRCVLRLEKTSWPSWAVKRSVFVTNQNFLNQCSLGIWMRFTDKRQNACRENMNKSPRCSMHCVTILQCQIEKACWCESLERLLEQPK